MNRRSKARPPKPGMVWSEKHGMWVDRDTRSTAQRVQDEAVAKDLEKDQRRIKAALRAAEAARKEQAAAIQDAAKHLADDVMKSLIEARTKAGLPQAEVARRMGVPQPVVVRLEAGTHSPTLATLARYAAAIGVNLEVRRIA